jgi:Peptidase A4 family
MNSTESREWRQKLHVGVANDTLLHVNPHSTCYLSHPSFVDDDRIELFADDAGDIHISTRISTADSTTYDVTEVTTAGNEIPHSLTLAADERSSYRDLLTFPTQFPQPSPDVIAPMPADLIDAENAKVVAQGYPPRPPEDAAPHLQATWARHVSRPWQRVNPHTIAGTHNRFGRHTVSSPASPTLPLPPPQQAHVVNSMLEPVFPAHARAVAESFFNENDHGWSGARVTSDDTFWQGSADWRIPRLIPQNQLPVSVNGTRSMAMWVGLGHGDNNLFQAGVEHQQWDAVTERGNLVSSDTYNVWLEVLPAAPYYLPNTSLLFLPNMPAAPGDHIYVSVFKADDYGNTHFFEDGHLNTKMWFSIANWTRNKWVWLTEPLRGRGYDFVGNSVEFILERPARYSDDGKDRPLPLANFCMAQMSNCLYMTDGGGYHRQYGLGPFYTLDKVEMINLVSADNARPLVYSALTKDSNSYGDRDVTWMQSGFFT